MFLSVSLHALVDYNDGSHVTQPCLLFYLKVVDHCDGGRTQFASLCDNSSRCYSVICLHHSEDD